MQASRGYDEGIPWLKQETLAFKNKTNLLRQDLNFDCILKTSIVWLKSLFSNNSCSPDGDVKDE